MKYMTEYASPLGIIYIASDGEALTGLWFEGQKYFPGLSGYEKGELPVFVETVKWLDVYFSGEVPDFTPKLKMSGTPFGLKVWKALLDIPYGKTVSYGSLAAEIGSSARAVGGAVGRNPISLIVPCHRVIGADGSLTGYAGGTEIKQKLLSLEAAGAEGRAGGCDPQRSRVVS